MTKRYATPFERFQWLRFLNHPDDPNLTISYVYGLSGPVAIDRMDAALTRTVTRAFPRLLDYFTPVGDTLQARTRPAPTRMLREVAEPAALLEAGGLDPAGQELCRFLGHRTPSGEYLLRMDFSHLVFDGGCYAPFLTALGAAWRGDEAPRERSVVAQPPSDLLAAQEFWRRKLVGRRLHQPLPFAFAARHPGGLPVTTQFTLDGADAVAVNRLLREREVSLLHLVVALTGALVHLRGGDEGSGVAIAHTVDTRRYGEDFGCHTNLLPLWLDAPADRLITDLLDGLRAEREELAPHEAFPTAELIALAPAAGALPSTGPALNLVVNSSPAMLPRQLPELAGLAARWVRKPGTANSSDLSVTFSADAEGVHVCLDSSTALMTAESLAALATDLHTLIRFATADPRATARHCDLSRPFAPVAEGPARAGPTSPLIRMLVDAATTHATRPAVVDEQGTLTHADLMTTARRLARRLGPGEGPIGTLLDRSAAVPVAYLAALLLGRTFVPLDPATPDARLKYMAATANVGVVLADARFRERAQGLFGGRRVEVVEPGTPTIDDPADDPADDVGLDGLQGDGDPERVAYVLFTSGSTGTPKGVMVSEWNLANFLLSAAADPGLGDDDRVLALTPTSFDISLLEILLPLLTGACVDILPDRARLDGRLLAERIASRPITVVQATPSSWRILRATGWRAPRPMTLLCGGEHLDADLAGYLLSQNATSYTMYGPTEATIWSSWQRLSDPNDVHLGLPARGTAYFVLDDEGRAVPPGGRGELLIAGDCVARGYLNAPGTPFRRMPDGTLGYHTGDLVRYEGAGRVSFLSRKDSQRKINGYRVEPGEVVAVVRAFSPEATVLAVVGERPEPHLRCFVWLPSDQPFNTTAALARCRESLPPYLVPLLLHRLRQIPMTSNGKADLTLLAGSSPEELDLYPPEDTARKPAAATPKSPAPALVGEPRRPPADPGDLEAELADLVATELHLPPPRVDQPLGYQGIGSLGYNVLTAAIEARYGVIVPAHEFYRLKTLQALAAALAERLADPTHPGADRPRPERAERVRRATVSAETAPATPGSPARVAENRLAVIGLDAVLPAGPDPQSFWEALAAGVDAVRPASEGRALPGERAGFLPQVSGFDARFFSMSPLEAAWTDPRQRLLLQSAWHALEDAGLRPTELAGTRTGCYVAATGADYALLQARTGHPQSPYSLVGHSSSMIANRLSAHFDWRGPSATIDTACSGSLIALVRACHDLRTDVCDTAVVGGASLILDSQVNEGLVASGLLSPGRRCATFDAAADGYVRGEGYGILVVRRLADALAAGDRILAVIERESENHGGRANSLTAPNPDAHHQLLLDAYTPDLAARTGYVETHGSGTAVGDAIEVDALVRAWAELAPGAPDGSIRLGAVKTNIGHLEAAAGIASVVKVVKALEHRTLPGNLHFSELNPAITLAGTPFRVLDKPHSWDVGGDEPLVAGISSFGFGGSNAHVVLSSPPRPRPPTAATGPRLVPLSARTPGALAKLGANLADHLERQPVPDNALTELADTLTDGREHFEYRQAWVSDSVQDLTAQLRRPSEPVRVVPHAEPTNLRDPHAARAAYLAGHGFDGRSARAAGGRLRLPGYPFDETDYWFTD